jgi:hypothetical protein
MQHIRVSEVGGAMFTPDSITGGETKMVGSVLFFEADTIEEVRKLVEGDIYYTSGVVSWLSSPQISFLP